ncbi:MAG: hypothetical protein J5I93_12480 [Pirellulaceae bacterium]|nr:hypothetical protein [Pirellulaceae bacterium]
MSTDKLRPRIQPRPTRSRRILLESLEPRILLAVSSEEQFFVYQLNWARHDPAGYAQEAGLPVSLSDVAARPPLAINSALSAASAAKAQELADYDYFGHRSQVTGVWPNQLLRDFGYPLPATLAVGALTYSFPSQGNSVESLAAGYADAATAMDELIVDAGINPPGHRQHLLGLTTLHSAAREIGVGYAHDADSRYRHYWTLHITAANTEQSFLTGVVYDDANGNRRFDQGEGLAGVSVLAGQQQTLTNAAGGWSLPVAAGLHVVQAFGGNFQGMAAVPVRVSDDNVAVDFISGQTAGAVDFTAWENSAPALNSGSELRLRSVPAGQEFSPAAGERVSDLLRGIVRDPDPDAAVGIAVTAVSPGGQLWFRNDGTWRRATVSPNAAWLLKPDDWLQVVPDPGFSGVIDVTFHAWDQATGVEREEFRADLSVAERRGGHTAYSAASQTARLTVGSPDLPPSPWQNPRDPHNVNDDLMVAPSDALILINQINSQGTGPLPALAAGLAPPPYVDVSGDRNLAPNDVLLVLNYLNQPSDGEGEGEAASRPAAAAGGVGPTAREWLPPDRWWVGTVVEADSTAKHGLRDHDAGTLPAQKRVTQGTDGNTCPPRSPAARSDSDGRTAAEQAGRLARLLEAAADAIFQQLPWNGAVPTDN